MITQETTSLEIEKNSSLSINELLDMQNVGLSVQRSAHVGNQFGADLVLASMGIRMLMVDCNYGARDRLYFPNLVIDEESHEEISSDTQLSTHGVVDMPYGKIGLSDFHISALKDAFGENSPIVSDSDYMRENIEIASDFLTALNSYHDNYFERYVGPHGVPRDPGITTNPVEKLGVYLFDEKQPQSGMLMPNIYNILLNFVIESIKYDTDEIFHISGPTMISYVDQIMPDLENLYDELVENSDFRYPLPSRLRVNLIAAAGAKFVVGADKQDALDETLSLLDEYETSYGLANEERKNLALSGKLSKNLADEINKPAQELRRKLQKSLGALSCLFYSINREVQNPAFTSQYTALRNQLLDPGISGNGLYVPKFNVELPVGEVEQSYIKLEKELSIAEKKDAKS